MLRASDLLVEHADGARGDLAQAWTLSHPYGNPSFQVRRPNSNASSKHPCGPLDSPVRVMVIIVALLSDVTVWSVTTMARLGNAFHSLSNRVGRSILLTGQGRLRASDTQSVSLIDLQQSRGHDWY